ncbi:phospholipid scramblase 1 isoform X2 [Folsomia candida]|uniref:phospholipid scramblase 1 isoform X2 n=1 Tax=Folsomia candida TaxID=158441 RepID=UPI000B8F1F28|nr:phospholipid scramblase 1 isoform X2 [Folsomia candida]
MWPEMPNNKPSTIHPFPLKGDMQSAITNQPRQKVSFSPDFQEVPEGLGGLVKTQHLFIKQSVYSSVETQYEVLNSEGEKIFMADETTDTSTKAWCRGTKPFDVSILIRSGMYRKEVMKMFGEPRSCGCGGDITLKSAKTTLGTIEHAIEWSYPHYFVRDAEGNDVLQVIGAPTPSCFSFSREPPPGEFNVLLPDGKTFVGKIAKYWNGKEKDVLLKSDVWGVKFPLEMEVTHKALLLGATFLLNFQYQTIE